MAYIPGRVPANWNEACRRAGGRARHNHVARYKVMERLTKVQKLLRSLGLRHGVQTQIARQLGVSCATVCRDFQRLEMARRGLACGYPQIRSKPASEDTRTLDRRAALEEELELDRRDSGTPQVPVVPPEPLTSPVVTTAISTPRWLPAAPRTRRRV